MSHMKESSANLRPALARPLFWLVLGMLMVGAVGYLMGNRGTWVFYTSAHLGALGLLGLFGWAAGVLACMKQRSFWRAFFIGGLLPVIAGIAGVLWFWLPDGGPLYCGGVVSLALALTVLIAYLLVRRKQLS